MFHLLDFWLGNWDVLSPARERLGENDITVVLSGAALIERWRDVGGAEGMSLFYCAAGVWKQVWVTDSATYKEKVLIGRTPHGGVIFQGVVQRLRGGQYLDRTTLTPLADGEVRQVIETSTDGGGTWRIGFDGLYVRRAGEPLGQQTGSPSEAEVVTWVDTSRGG